MIDESKALVKVGEILPKTPNREIVTRSRVMATGGTVGQCMRSFTLSLWPKGFPFWIMNHGEAHRVA
ncbi:MAG: hypothetical protein PHV74_12980 [Dehalococcoidia bacterium]|nr:hypothetical protein [Dehalococcoidia bacterium]